jgi:MoxR-like ATPase
MSFDVYETQERIEAKERPIVVITSNNEKELPDAFLRRCFFHYIKFPDRETMQDIIDVHFPGIQKVLVKKVLVSKLLRLLRIVLTNLLEVQMVS